MDFKVGVGKSDFKELRESGNYYVDKTELIYELVNDTGYYSQYLHLHSQKTCCALPQPLRVCLLLIW